MIQSRLEDGDPSPTQVLAELAELDAVDSALLLERSGRILERTGAGDRERGRRAATLAAALHQATGHLAAALGADQASRIVIPAGERAILLLPVPTRGDPLLLLLVCDGEESAELEDRLDGFLRRMSEERPTTEPATEDLEASLLEGLERLFPQTDESVE